MKNSIKLLAITAIVAVIGFAFIACDDGNLNGEGDDTVISIKAIAGVTAPVQGETPVTAITANDQYTGTVAWNHSPVKFAYATEYVATITLTAKKGYTLQGVTANFFTVAGALSVINAANSGVVTATFSPTADDPSQSHLSGDITISPDTGVTVGTPLTAHYDGDEDVSFSYQWEKDGVEVGTDSDTYTPIEEGTYTVTISAAGYNPKTSDPVTVILPTNLYIITGDASSFTATKDGATVETGAIQDVINAIRTDVNGDPVSIQFVGTGENALDIGTASAQFINDTGSTWGLITLSGKITSTNATATEGTVMIGAGVSVNSMADIAIATTATGANSRAIYKVGAGTVNISSGLVTVPKGTAVYSFNDGVITVSGSADIRSGSDTTSAAAIYISGTGSPDKARLSITGGSVKNTYSGILSYAVYNASNISGGPVEIKGGTVSVTGSSGSAVYNYSTGVVNISDGTLSAASYYAVYNSGAGTVNISGGKLEATSGNAVFNYSTGTVNISGGELSAETGHAVRNYSTGKITVSGDALITSANTTATAGTIYIVSAGTTTTERLSITGGTVQNTSTGNAIYNDSTGAVSVSGSTISAPLGFAVANANANAALTLSGTPLITGNLRAPAGKLSVTGFVPGSNKYYLDFASYTAGDIAVTDGGAYGTSFTLFYQPTWKLETSGGNLVIATDIDPNSGTYSYTLTGSGSNFTAQKSGVTIANGTGAIQDVINAIRTDAFNRDVSIQLGSGSDTLDIGTDSAQFNNAGGRWGSITLSGKITSANVTQGTVMIGVDILVVNSTADIANTAANSSARAVYIAGTTGNTQTVNIQSGTIAATAAYGRALYIAGAGTVNISGGTVSATSGYAVYNGNSSGTVNISGGTVSSTSGQTIRNDYNGPVNISGGTVSATTGQAVYNDYNGIITVSNNATVTSANTSVSSGTIYCSSLGSSTLTNLTRIIINGGTVQNTSTGATGNAVYNASVGRVSISGGTISTTATTTAYAVQNTSTSTTANTGAILLSGDPTITGRLRPSATGRLTATASFNPSASRLYTLDYAAYTAGNIAVIGGAASDGKFTLYNQTAWKLAVSGSDLVIAANQ
jgi:hypothetical protein